MMLGVSSYAGNYSAYGFEILLSRSLGPFILSVYLPSAMFVTMSWVSFFIPPVTHHIYSRYVSDVWRCTQRRSLQVPFPCKNCLLVPLHCTNLLWHVNFECLSLMIFTDRHFQISLILKKWKLFTFNFEHRQTLFTCLIYSLHESSCNTISTFVVSILPPSFYFIVSVAMTINQRWF